MGRVVRGLCIAFVVFAGTVGVARADVPWVPSSANSVCPPTVSFASNDSCCFDVTVRDVMNNPVAGATVVVDFGSCPMAWCPTQPPGVTVIVAANQVRTMSDAAGVAHFCICATTSAGTPCPVTIYADGVQLCSLPADSCGSVLSADTCSVEAWQQVAVGGPGARWSSAMVANDERGSVFLYGGAGTSGNFGDTWEWDGTEWNFTANTGPFAREGHAMAYDRLRGKVVLFGGRVAGAWDQQTWEWDAATGWNLRSNSGPSPRAGHAMAYDPNRQQVLLFGGFDGGVTKSDTWAWNGNAWVPIAGPAPPARMKSAMATDPLRKRVVLYGGSATSAAGGALDDTWEFDGTSWARAMRPDWNGFSIVQIPIAGPPARWRHGMTYGASCGRIVLTGGENAFGQLMPTTWSWDGAQWREGVTGVAASSAPMAYDIARGRVMVFGGNGAGGLGAISSQLCTLCNDEAAELDALGNVVYPPTLDPGTSVTETVVNEERGDTRILFPGRHTSADSWLKDFPCATAIGGTVPPEAEDPALDDSLLALGINASAQTIADSLASWEQQLLTLLQVDPDSLQFAAPVGDGPFPLPAIPYCPPDSGVYVFGGRDIVFVHGLQLKHVFDKVGAVATFDDEHPSLADWVPPAPGQPGYTRNPEFYRRESSPGAGNGGYYRQVAEDNWEPHIEEFFKKHNIRNRYLIVAYPCNDRLEVGIQAMLTQINDAMRYGINVVNPPFATNVGKFGTPSFVVVSHSTGGLLTDAALHAAQTNLNLNAQFIAERCKAHVGLASALSGSRLATSALVIAGAISGVSMTSDPWICPLFQALRAILDIDNTPPCPILAWIALRSVLPDLVPAYTKLRWGNAVDQTNIPTVNLVGAHSQLVPVLKHIISPGLDDGVLTVNSASANPAFTTQQPNGFMTHGIPGLILTFDMGMWFDGVTRAIQNYAEQVIDPRLQFPTVLIPWYVASGPITYLSPTGMLQSVAWEFSNTEFDPMRRFQKHYSFMSCAADHFNIRSADNYPDYFPHHYELMPLVKFRTFEEARALREEDEPAFRAHYNTIGAFHYPNDDQPLMTEACTPGVLHLVRGVQRGFKIKVFGKVYSKYWWIWKRNYMRPALAGTRHVCDYMYESILNCESPVGLCTPSTDAGGTTPRVDYARVLDHPVRGREATIELGLSGAGAVHIRVYDLAGRLIRTLAEGTYPPGVHRVRWDGVNARGGRVEAGVYFVRVEFPSQSSRVSRVVLLGR